MKEQYIDIKGGRWWYFGEGASGVTWYNMGPATEECRNRFGYLMGVTVAEALVEGALEVDEATGTPLYCPPA
jgi:hypothetical protein